MTKSRKAQKIEKNEGEVMKKISVRMKTDVKHTKEVETTGHHSVKQGHFLKDLFIRGIIVAVSLTIIRSSMQAQQARGDREDVYKDESVSFAQQYFEGKLDKLGQINQILIAAAASVTFDAFVIYYHLAYPAHPKFLIVFSRKVCIFVHLISGITEIVCGIAAFFVASRDLQQVFAVGVAVASVFHSITAYYQSAVVFGAKGIMTPGYLYAITIHISFAFKLLQQPTSLMYLLTTFLMLHIYVWCRFFVYFFRKLSAFNGYHYTIAISFSGALLFPYALGPVANFNFLLIAALYCVLEAILSKKTGKDLARKLFAEHERYAMLTSDTVTTWKSELSETGIVYDEKLAKEVFDRYDHNRDGTMSVVEIDQFIKSIKGTPISVPKVMAMADVDKTGSIHFDEFYRFVWNYGTMKDRLIKLPPTGNLKTTGEDQARLVFNMLDTDQSGYIDLSELGMLLSQWGMPEGEADAYLDLYGGKRNRRIAFEVFYKQMEPIWKFAITEVYDQ